MMSANRSPFALSEAKGLTVASLNPTLRSGRTVNFGDTKK